MPSKNFEHSVKFREVKTQNGTSVWFPIVEVFLITPINSRVSLSLLFDTGANVTTLRANLYPLLGLRSWDEGLRVLVGTGGGQVVAYEYTTTMEIFGKSIQCPIHLSQELQGNPLFSGLLGRNTVFNEFGFGFWESTRELFVAETP
jgi:hypothetical protein